MVRRGEARGCGGNDEMSNLMRSGGFLEALPVLRVNLGKIDGMERE
jgi:hypothetical protein